ncbi:hypothetical protein PIB30_071232 [Stylosanthes scabra]|uniref:Uncharacterized protein n=1 Tax=Stylosanthes scabra TaxID=79078 RepID=A0ABU6SNV1_9FABA|nr:hypothetical protein [Stylosanthes scabra]
MTSSSSPSAQTKSPHHLWPEKGLSGFSSVLDHLKIGRNPHPHHCGTFAPLPWEGILTHELYLLDREEQPDPWLLFNCIICINSEHHNLEKKRTMAFGNWGSKIEFWNHSGAKVSHRITFATSINDPTSYKATVRSHGIQRVKVNSHVGVKLTEVDRRANGSHVMKSGVPN